MMGLGDTTACEILEESVRGYRKKCIASTISKLNKDTLPSVMLLLAKLWNETGQSNKVSKLKEGIAFALYKLIQLQQNVSESESDKVEIFLFYFLCTTDLNFVKKCGLAALEQHLKNTQNQKFLSFLDLIQGLDETQVHLIAPILCKFDGLVKELENSGSRLCFLGLLVFYKAMNHCNGWVALSAIKYFLQTYPFEFMLCNEENSVQVLQFFFAHFLPLLNSGDLFLKVSDGKCPTHTALENFVQSLTNVVQMFLKYSDNCFPTFLFYFGTLFTASAPAYFISLVLKQASVTKNKPVTLHDFEVLRVCLQKVGSLEFSLIRKSVFCNILLAFLNNYKFKLNAKLCESLISILYEVPQEILDTALMDKIAVAVSVDSHSLEILKALLNSIPVQHYLVASILFPRIFPNSDIEQLKFSSQKLYHKLLLNACQQPYCTEHYETYLQPVFDLVSDFKELDDFTIIPLVLSVLKERCKISPLGKNALKEIFISFLHQTKHINAKYGMVLQLLVVLLLNEKTNHIIIDESERLELLGLWEKINTHGRLTFDSQRLRSEPYVCTKVIDQYHSDILRLRLLCISESSEPSLANDLSLIAPSHLPDILKKIVGCLQPKNGNHFIMKDNDFKCLLQMGISSLSDCKGHGNYSVAAYQFCKLMFCEQALVNHSSLVFEFSFSLLKQAVQNGSLASALASGVRNATFCHHYTFMLDYGPFWKLLIQLSLFGPICRKGYRVYSPTFQFIQYTWNKENEEMNCLPLESPSFFNFTQSSALTREYGVCALLECLSQVSKNSQRKILHQLILELVDPAVVMVNDQVPKLAGNFCFGHRLLNRRLQLMLALIRFIKRDQESCYLVVFQFCTEQMSTLRQQPSTRHLIEWILILIIIDHPPSEDLFYAMQDDLSNERSGCMVSWIGILLHKTLALLNGHCDLLENDGEKLIEEGITSLDRFIPHLLGWCTSQVFITRCFAIASFKRLWTALQSLKHAKIVSFLKSHSYLANMVNFQFEQKNASKYISRLQTTFFLASFDPLLFYSVNDIYCSYPLITNWPPEEIISIGGCDHQFKSTIPIKANWNVHEDMDSFEEVIYPSPETSPLENLMQAYEGRVTCHFQQKIVPKIDELEEGDRIEDTAKGGEEDGDIILIASLIEKPFNLGGLCRTSEVLGVSTIVVDKSGIVNDHSFMALSVSSHNHIQLEEVKREHVAIYLNQVSKIGYTIVGAEQTSASCSLATFQFPAKTALLLGNEKEGIPMELLELVDVCVQIPQLGITRSLNVHVSGAILLYEYTKQHKFMKTTLAQEEINSKQCG